MERLPVNMIGELLEAALGHGFQFFYNLFKAWAQSQRTPLIREMLGNACRSRLFRFWKCGSSEDMASFEELMDVACHMGIGDAIVFTSCRDIFRNPGNSNAQFVALEELSATGRFLAQVATFITKILFRRHSSVSALNALLSLHQNNLYRQRIVSDVESVEVIYRLAVPLGIPPTVDRLMSCPLHSTGDAKMFISNCLESEVCLFCDMACMINKFAIPGATK